MLFLFYPSTITKPEKLSRVGTKFPTMGITSNINHVRENTTLIVLHNLDGNIMYKLCWSDVDVKCVLDHAVGRLWNRILHIYALSVYMCWRDVRDYIYSVSWTQ